MQPRGPKLIVKQWTSEGRAPLKGVSDVLASHRSFHHTRTIVALHFRLANGTNVRLVFSSNPMPACPSPSLLPAGQAGPPVLTAPPPRRRPRETSWLQSRSCHARWRYQSSRGVKGLLPGHAYRVVLHTRSKRPEIQPSPRSGYPPQSIASPCWSALRLREPHSSLYEPA